LTNTMVARILLEVSLILLVYIYAGYPLLVLVLSAFSTRTIRKRDITPKITFIIAARNEERVIRAKLDNTLALDYPRDKIEVIVASDCSTDRTDEIVREFSARGVRLHRQSKRLGKTMAQNAAAAISQGDILVFSDAPTIYSTDALRKIVRNFADPEVGCVTGQLVYKDLRSSGVGKGCRSYWNYEKLLRTAESRLGLMLGVTGCISAVRRSCYAKLPRDLSSDFVIALEMHLLERRTVYEPDAVAIDFTNSRSGDEMQMRVRVVEQTLAALSHYSSLLNPLKHGMFAFLMVSHKLLRYTAPIYLVAALVSALCLTNAGPLFRDILVVQLVCYVAALAGWIADLLGKDPGPTAYPYYFALANTASVRGFLKFALGEDYITWEPVREPA
jgi:cellulose synthase/poly-beta-1,6-N-acetylglucosamine synthase-like glycosyltransferase